MCVLVLAWASVIMILVAVDQTMTDTMVFNFRLFSGIMLVVYMGAFGAAGYGFHIIYKDDPRFKPKINVETPTTSAGPANPVGPVFESAAGTAQLLE